ncbi:MAG: MAPEG family protein [Parasphingorhabdus sp.]
MTIPIIASVAGAVLVILQAILMILVGMHRIRNRINLGTGDDPVLERKIRRHGNLAENAALFIVVLALAEMTVVPNNVVAIIAIIFIIGRILHAIALSTVAGSQGAKTGKIFQAFRAIGALTTFGSFIALGSYLLAGIF